MVSQTALKKTVFLEVSKLSWIRKPRHWGPSAQLTGGKAWRKTPGRRGTKEFLVADYNLIRIEISCIRQTHPRSARMRIPTGRVRPIERSTFYAFLEVVRQIHVFLSKACLRTTLVWDRRRNRLFERRCVERRCAGSPPHWRFERNPEQKQ